jgi:hypothetical protein
MATREIRKSLTTTEFIELEDGTTFIIDRKHTVETHRERMTDKENNTNKQKWAELDQTHRSDLEQEHLPKLVNQAHEGEQYILNAVLEQHKADDKQEAFGVQNI